MSYLSVSTWSLHRLLGPLRWTIWDAETRSHRTKEQEQPLALTLLELPAEAARRGYQAIEVCHFHFPSTDSAYLQQLKQAFTDAGLSFDTLLLDYGDLTNPDAARREADKNLIREWIFAAAQCGAKRIRVIAGEASPDDEEAIRLSAETLTELAAYAESLGVAVITENFKPLTSTGASCTKLLGHTGNAVGFITDFGNFEGALKYDEIAMTVPVSSSIHVKPQYDTNGIPDEEELRRCLDSVRAQNYIGSYVLIYDGPGDMWEGLERVKRLVMPYVQG